MTRPRLIFGDRYRLDERIAAGGVGQVWRAEDLLLERPVAVKLLRPEYADHSETLERFHTEARHAGQLNHPCVAQVYDYGHAGPGRPPYLVMEFVDGPSLAGLLAADPLEPAFALDVIAQAASGLHAAHRIGLVHRDVKPGNILIGPENRVKITDFGIAHAAGQAPVTSPGLVMGTAHYMAPERIAGGAGTPASDLYALGIVLHECLTGLPPFEGSAAEVMAGHLYLPLPPLPADAPPELDALVARLTAKDPASRLSDANELAALAARLRDEMKASRLAPPARSAGRPPYRDQHPRAAQAPQTDPGLLAGPGRLGEGGPTAPPEPSLPTSAAGQGAMDGAEIPMAGGARGSSPRRRRRAATLGAAAVLLIGACLTAVLTSGVLRSAPAADHHRAGASLPARSVVPSRATHTTPTASASPAATDKSSAKKAGKPGHDRKAQGASAPASPSATSGASTSPAPATPPTTSSSASSTPGPVPSAAPSPSASNCLLGLICL